MQLEPESSNRNPAALLQCNIKSKEEESAAPLAWLSILKQWGHAQHTPHAENATSEDKNYFLGLLGATLSVIRRLGEGYNRNWFEVDKHIVHMLSLWCDIYC